MTDRPHPPGPPPRRGLTREEFEEVMRRAAELAASDPEGSGEGTLSEGEVLRIGSEVGLPECHVRRAMADLRSGGAALEGGGIFGPGTIRAARVVDRPADEVKSALDRYFTGTTLFQRIRAGPSRLQYRPAVDWASQIARSASSTAGKYFVAAARRVDVHLEEPGPGTTWVELEVDPGTRGEYVWGGWLGGSVAGGAAGFGAAAALTGGLAVALAPAVGAGLVVGGAATALVVRWSAGAHRRRLDDVRQEMEGLLDRLEAGETLDPPPPAWRRWVRRHFHGVARELGIDEDENGT